MKSSPRASRIASRAPSSRPIGRALEGGLVSALLLLVGCASHPPMPTVEDLDLERFMGDWYVQAHIPVGSEKHAYNGVESYALDEKGRVLTSYVYRDGGFDAELEVDEPIGFVSRESNAVWGMQFLWPFEAEFLVAHVDEGYTETIIARTKRDYVWIMTREALISDERLAELSARLVPLGYDPAELRRVPQRWPDPGHPVSRAEGSLATFTRR